MRDEIKMPPLETANILSVLTLIGASFIAGPASAAKAPRPPDPCDRKELSVDDLRDILPGPDRAVAGLYRPRCHPTESDRIASTP